MLVAAKASLAHPGRQLPARLGLCSNKTPTLQGNLSQRGNILDVMDVCNFRGDTMKTNFSFLLLILFLLVACVPPSPAPTVSPSSAPVSVGSCLITPHNYARQDNPIPIAALVNFPGSDEINLIWRDGTTVGTWQTGFLVPRTNAHVAGVAPGWGEAVPLVFMGSDENGLIHLNVGMDGKVNSLKEFPQTVAVTGLVGIPGRPVLAYSTVEPRPDGSGVRSQIFLGDYQTIATASPILTVDNNESRAVLPVAIHRDINNKPDGLWYTYSLWGIGGDSLTDPRSGLYYFDLATGESMEFLSMGCNFSDLSTMQNWAAWTSDGVLYSADLHTAKTVSFPRLAGNDRGPVHAFIGPGDGYVAWLEGKGSEWDGTLKTTVRIGTLEGYLIGEYPLSAFVTPSGLGEGIALLPLGWMASENYSLVLAVYNASVDRAVLLSLDANNGQISLLSELGEGNFAGFAYP